MKLIENAAFMAVTMADLQADINAKGTVISTVTGNGFTVLKDTPSVKQYTTLISRYNTTIAQLAELMPSSKVEAERAAGEALAKFVVSGKGVNIE